MATTALLFVAPSAYPLGGVATWLEYLLPGLAQQGWQPVLGLVHGKWHDAAAYRRAYPALETVVIPNPTGSHEGRLLALTQAFGRLAPAAVIGVNIPDSYAAVARMRLRAQAAPRALMTIHGIQPDLYEDLGRFRAVLDGVACTNRLACRLAEVNGMEPGRIHYAPYGVPLPPALEFNAREDASPLRIAFVGRLEQWQKRVMDLPKIAAALAQQGVPFELLIAGAGPQEPQLRAALAQYSADGRVRFLGSLSSAQLSKEVYGQAHVLLLTSLWETGPLVIWEAMSHGLAIATSRYVGSVLEDGLHDDDNCLTFPVGDAALAADCLARLLDDAVRRRLAARALDLLESRYSRPRSIEAWSRCIEAVLSSPPRAAVAEPLPVQPAGRLDRSFGTGWGERLRRAAGISFAHGEPGGEWPHSYGRTPVDSAPFWQQAASLDAAHSPMPDSLERQGE
jgi:glycosyltransferase involved in cell wall biosynthesis